MIRVRGLPSNLSSSTKIVLEDFPAGIFRCGTEIFSSVPRKTCHIKFLGLDSTQSRILKPLPLRSSSSIKVSEVKLEATEIEELEKSPQKTVRVRFQLRKECGFGEQFFILGDDPVFGLWDPEIAVPLNWSDGHAWTVDLDLPVGKLVEFKFILKGKTGEILWQPGPNRDLETWETNNTIKICEDWENPELQMIIEEKFEPLNEEKQQSSICNSVIPMVSENITDLYQISSSDAEREEEVLGKAQQISAELVAESVGQGSDDSEILSSGIQSEKNMETLNGAPEVTSMNVTEDAIISEEECLLLVPGLVSQSDFEKEEVSGEGNELTSISNMSVEAINEDKAETYRKVDKKQENKRERNMEGKIVTKISLFEKSEQEVVNGVEQRHYDAAEEEVQQQRRRETETVGTPHVVLEKDIQWGRKTLYKLLNSFGLF